MQRTPAGEIDSPRRFTASGHPHLAPGRLLDRQRHHGLLDFDRRAVLQDRLLAADRPPDKKQKPEPVLGNPIHFPHLVSQGSAYEPEVTWAGYEPDSKDPNMFKWLQNNL
jgi:hypothetical protein